MPIDDSAVIWSAPERERADRPLIVLLHGYGSHEGDLFSLSPALPLDAVVASVRAPLVESGGYAWWSLQGQTPGDPDPVAVDAAAQAVLDWLDTVQYTAVSLLGFSQGGAVSLQLLRLAPRRFRAAVCLSGFIAAAPSSGCPPTRPRRDASTKICRTRSLARSSPTSPPSSPSTGNARGSFERAAPLNRCGG